MSQFDSLRINPETGQPEVATAFEPVTRQQFEDAVAQAQSEHDVAKQELASAEAAQVELEAQYDAAVNRVNEALKAEEAAAEAVSFQEGGLAAFDQLLQSRVSVDEPGESVEDVDYADASEPIAGQPSEEDVAETLELASEDDGSIPVAVTVTSE